VGNETAMEGLLVAWPAAAFALRSAAKVAASGGQAQGTAMGFPLAPLTAPSQLPVPVGLTFAACPKAGIRAAGTSRLWLMGIDETVAMKATVKREVENFILEVKTGGPKEILESGLESNERWDTD